MPERKGIRKWKEIRTGPLPRRKEFKNRREREDPPHLKRER
jgi:hypothetical protein